MPTITVSSPTPPPLAFLTWTPVGVDQTGAIIPVGPPASVRIADGATFTLTAGTVYRLRNDGRPGGTTYVTTTADCTDVDLVESHQIDPTTLEPVTSSPTVAALIAALGARTTALENAAPVDLADGTGRIG